EPDRAAVVVGALVVAVQDHAAFLEGSDRNRALDCYQRLGSPRRGLVNRTAKSRSAAKLHNTAATTPRRGGQVERPDRTEDERVRDQQQPDRQECRRLL